MGKTNDAGATRRDERIAVSNLQPLPSLATGRLRLDLVCLLERRQQRLSLGDLSQLRRRRKGFKRWRENGVRFDGAASRLIEFGQRQRRAQLEAARALPPRDGDGGLEKPLPRARGWRGRA